MSAPQDKMAVDLELFGRALFQLRDALAALEADPQNSYVRDSVVKRYEFTYELGVRPLARYLQTSSFSSVEVEDLTFQGIIRRGDKAELLLAGWPGWRRFREARNQTAHTYNEEKAAAVIATARSFVEEANNLFRKLTERMSEMAELGTLDLSREDLEIVLSILRSRVADRPVFVFGSRVTGKARRRSDLDLAVGGGPMSLELRADLAEDFDESNLPIEVDVVELATASVLFRRRIQRDWLPLSFEASIKPNKDWYQHES